MRWPSSTPVLAYDSSSARLVPSMRSDEDFQGLQRVTTSALLARGESIFEEESPLAAPCKPDGITEPPQLPPYGAGSRIAHVARFPPSGDSSPGEYSTATSVAKESPAEVHPRMCASSAPDLTSEQCNDRTAESVQVDGEGASSCVALNTIHESIHQEAMHLDDATPVAHSSKNGYHSILFAGPPLVPEHRIANGSEHPTWTAKWLAFAKTKHEQGLLGLKGFCECSCTQRHPQKTRDYRGENTTV